MARVWWWPLVLGLGCGARSGLDVGASNGRGGSPSVGSGGASGGPIAKGTGGVATGGVGTGGAPLRARCTLSSDDPRVAGIRPDEIATLDGADFVEGDVARYHWRVATEDCDAVVRDAEFSLTGVDSRIVQFQPSRPAPYHFTLEATGVGGDSVACNLEVPVEGVGLRVELCWDTSTSTDLDLYLHTPFNQAPWFDPGAPDVTVAINDDTCNTSNAVAMLRLPTRLNWGYADSALSACNTPSFEGFLGVGRCPNPRAADDNNQRIANGTTERMQLDNPREGQRFRVMAHNFTNTRAQPHVFVYCSGEKAFAGDPPLEPANFVTANPGVFGVMWRAADITTSLDARGRVRCTVEPLRGPAALTIDDPSF